MPFVVEYLESIQYDGTNGTFICGEWCVLPLVSDDGTVLVAGGVDGDFHTAHVGDWFVKASSAGSNAWVIPKTQYETRFREITVN